MQEKRNLRVVKKNSISAEPACLLPVAPPKPAMHPIIKHAARHKALNGAFSHDQSNGRTLSEACAWLSHYATKKLLSGLDNSPSQALADTPIQVQPFTIDRHYFQLVIPYEFVKAIDVSQGKPSFVSSLVAAQSVIETTHKKRPVTVMESDGDIVIRSTAVEPIFALLNQSDFVKQHDSARLNYCTFVASGKSSNEIAR